MSIDSSWLEILDAARAGDESALNSVCEQVRDYLVWVAEANLHDGMRAKVGASDIVQESLLEVRSDIHNFRGNTEAEFRGWIVRLVQHNLLDSAKRFQKTQARDISREVALDQTAESSSLVSSEQTASSIVRRRETDEEMLRAVNRLTAKQRQVVKLHHRDGCSYEEISQTMQITVDAVRHLMARATDSLKVMLARKVSDD